MLGRLLHIANTAPADRERFYAMKDRILKRFGRCGDLVLQAIPGKDCWTCDGTGLFEHYSGDKEYCQRCCGTGWFKHPVYVTLEEWTIAKYKFLRPIQRSPRVPTWFQELLDSGNETAPSIEGYVTHTFYPHRKIRRATLLLSVVFDRSLFSVELGDEFRSWAIVQAWRRRCWDCKCHMWWSRAGICSRCTEKRRAVEEAPF
jgi:hypothetical protein